VPRSITGTLSRRRTLRVAALLAAPAAAVALLSGCGAGQISQTDGMVATVPGISVDSKHGVASLRDVQIKYNNPQGYAVGATAPLSLYIANNDPAKKLVLRSVTAVGKQTGAKLGTVVLTGGTADVGVLPSAIASAASTPSTAPSASASRKPAANRSAGPTASASSAPSTDTADSPSTAPSPSATNQSIDFTIPAYGYARLDREHGGYLAITGLTESLAPGSSALVTFTFEGENPLQVEVPFGIPLSPAQRITPSGAGAE
jgi:hypothetical protein